MTRLLVTLIFLFTAGALNGQDCDCDFFNPDQDTAWLIIFYRAMGDTNWTNKEHWGDTDTPVGSWDGISVTAETPNCISCLDLDGQMTDPGDFTPGCDSCNVMDDAPPGNNLVVTTGWPNNFALPCLRKLALDNNQLDIPLPSFSGFTSLCELYLRDNKLRGVLSAQHFDNPRLSILNLNDNELTGGIPANLGDVLPLLERLLVSNNDLTELLATFPEGLTSLTVDGNRLTFEDILPAVDALGSRLTYNSQQPVFRVINTIAPLGLPFSIALDFDLEVPDNVYQWYLRGVPVADQTTNTLRFDSLTAEHAGEWTVRISNPRAPEEILESFPITIDTCSAGIREEVISVCPNEIVRIDDITFTGDTIYYLPIPAQNGCDSVWKVKVIRLTPQLTFLDTFVCVGQVLLLGDTTYEPGQHDVLSDENCPTSFSDTLRLTVLEASEETLGAATITDSISCGPTFHPGGNLPPGTFGRWELFENAFTPDLTDPDAIITGLSPGENLIRWELGAGACPEYSSTSRIIFQEPILDLLDDTPPTLFDDQSQRLEAAPFDVLNNDNGWQDLMDPFDLIITIPPRRGSAQFDEEDRLLYRRSLGTGVDTLTYGIVRPGCPVDEGQVFISIESKFLGVDQMPPNVITPDGDGYNDVLKIPLLEYNPGAFPNSRLEVYHNQVFLFAIDNYQDHPGWDGRLPDGSFLPAGNFYRYVIEYGDERFDPHGVDLKIIYQR